ncbi:MAG: hypothetical protein U0Q18_01530 [Bryobacteraceae bacterium]
MIPRVARILPLLAATLSVAAPPAVRIVRTPQAGIQPQVAAGGDGVIHLIYFLGDPAAGDVYYARKQPDAREFSKAVRVNSQSGSVMAIGTIRGAQLAVGRGGRVHVAWNGSRKAEPKAPGDSTPMLYTRLNDTGAAFEPQRNLIQNAVGLDGGGSVAAGGDGGVYVVWHAPGPGKEGEQNRQVWIARSHDDGTTFAPEQPAWQEPAGACGCCGMRAFADPRGPVYILYRAATHGTDRDMMLLASNDNAASLQGVRVHPWKLNACPMTSDFLAADASGVLAVWETAGQVYFAHADPRTLAISTPVAPPGHGKRKHPVIARNSDGDTLLVWTEGTGRNKGGSVAWQLFDGAGRPTPEHGEAGGLPAWSLAAVFVNADGSFTIVY